MKDVFEIVKLLCNFRNDLKIKPRKIHSVRQCIETVPLVDARAWNSLPSGIKIKRVNPLHFSNLFPPDRLRANHGLKF